jgi:hypothetical protein
MVGENFDLSSNDGSVPSKERGGRPFVGIQFTCCGVYARIYLNRQATAYEGHCPRCSRQVRIRIGPGGTDRRFFTAY